MNRGSEVWFGTVKSPGNSEIMTLLTSPQASIPASVIPVTYNTAVQPKVSTLFSLCRWVMYTAYVEYFILAHQSPFARWCSYRRRCLQSPERLAKYIKATKIPFNIKKSVVIKKLLIATKQMKRPHNTRHSAILRGTTRK